MNYRLIRAQDQEGQGKKIYVFAFPYCARNAQQMQGLPNLLMSPQLKVFLDVAKKRGWRHELGFLA